MLPSELAECLKHAALETKAENLLVFSVEGQSVLCDYVIVCEGTSQAHVKGIADKIEGLLKDRVPAILPQGIEGQREGRWVLLDYGDVIVHVFHPETRKYYNLERLLSHPRSTSVLTDEDSMSSELHGD